MDCAVGERKTLTVKSGNKTKKEFIDCGVAKFPFQLFEMSNFVVLSDKQVRKIFVIMLKFEFAFTAVLTKLNAKEIRFNPNYYHFGKS